MARRLGEAYVEFSQRGMGAVSKTAGRAMGALRGVAGFAGRAAAGIARIGVGGALAATAAGVYGIQQQMQELDNTAKLAGRTGLGAATIAGLGFAAEQGGSSVETMNGSLQAFTRRLGAAKDGTGPAVQAFDQLGISAAELASLSTEDAILRVSDALSQQHDQTVKMNIADALFSERGRELVNVLGMGADGLKEYKREANDLGLGFDAAELAKVEEANDAMNRIKRTVGATFGQLAIEAAPTISMVAQKTLEAIKTAKTYGDSFSQAWQAGKTFFQSVQDGFADAGIVAGVVAADWGNVWKGMFEFIPQLGKPAFDWIVQQAKNTISDIAGIAVELPDILDRAFAKANGKGLAKKNFLTGEVKELSEVDIFGGVNGGKGLAGIADFELPPIPPEWKELGGDIDSALETARKIREEQRAQIDQVPQKLPKLPAADAGQEWGAAAGEEFAEKQSQAQSGSASSIFKTLRDSLLSDAGKDSSKEILNENQKQTGILQTIADKAAPVFAPEVTVQPEAVLGA